LQEWNFRSDSRTICYSGSPPPSFSATVKKCRLS
jgi:hypothetical protein